MPIRNASLSLVPNHWIASSLIHGGTLSMNSLPTASMGETTSMIPGDQHADGYCDGPATKPAIAPYGLASVSGRCRRRRRRSLVAGRRFARIRSWLVLSRI